MFFLEREKKRELFYWSSSLGFSSFFFFCQFTTGKTLGCDRAHGNNSTLLLVDCLVGPSVSECRPLICNPDCCLHHDSLLAAALDSMGVVFKSRASYCGFSFFFFIIWIGFSTLNSYFFFS